MREKFYSEEIAEKYLPKKALGRFLYVWTLATSLSITLGSGLGEISYTSLLLSLVPIFWGVYLGVLSVRGEITMPLWHIFFVILPMVIFIFTAKAVITFFERVF